MTGLSGEPVFDSVFDNNEELLHVSKRRLGIVVVIYEPMFVMIAFRQDLVDCETRLLHHDPSVSNFPETSVVAFSNAQYRLVCLLRRRTLSGVCTIPLRRRI